MCRKRTTPHSCNEMQETGAVNCILFLGALFGFFLGLWVGTLV